MNSRIILLLAGALLAIIFLYSFSGNETTNGYKEEIEKERKEKDDYMRHSEESPLREAQDFAGLHYFDVDARYRINAQLIPIEEKKVVVLITSDGKEKRFFPYGYAVFEFENKECRLKLLEVIDMGVHRGTLFLGFADETSTRETYGAGRYLDVKKVPGSSSITLDFNRAYNPYCAYNDLYSCPLPLRENVLPIAIRAGEKNYH